MPEARDFCRSNSSDSSEDSIDGAWADIDRLERERDAEDVIPPPPPHPVYKRGHAAKSESDDSESSSRKRRRFVSPPRKIESPPRRIKSPPREKRRSEMPARRRNKSETPPRRKRSASVKHHKRRKTTLRSRSASPAARQAETQGRERRGRGVQINVPPAMPGPQVIPVLHSVMMARVQLVNQKGAFMQLSDGGPTRYFDGLLRRRPGVYVPKTGNTLFVKVVRLESGLVMVDNRTVDSQTGIDKDPNNESAEVETWLDIPSVLVGNVIGKKGAQIRRLCEESGADLRFDEVLQTKTADADRPADSRNKKKVTGGAGDDLRLFLDAAREDEAETPAKQEEQEDDEGADDGADMRKFLQDMMGGDSSDEEMDESKEEREAKVAPKIEDQIVEFTAKNADEWETKLFQKMKDAGVEEVQLDKLTVIDFKGARIDISRGFGKEMFPIRVKYAVPAAQKAPKLETSEIKKEEKDELRKKLTAAQAEADFLDRVKKKDEEQEEMPAAKARAWRNAILIGRTQRLKKEDFEEIFNAKQLPLPCDVERLNNWEVLCIFKSADDVAAALEGLESGYDDFPEHRSPGPGLWRFCKGQLEFRFATPADENKKIEKLPDGAMAMSRLRINGDAAEVGKAETLVRGLLSELLGKHKPRGSKDYAPALKQGDVRELCGVPAEYVGRLIGKGGETITRLETESGARLRILPRAEDTPEGEQTLVAQGPAANVSDALDRIEALLTKLAGPAHAKDSTQAAKGEQRHRRNDEPDFDVSQAWRTSIHVGGTERLTQKHFPEIFKAKELPLPTTFYHTGISEGLCIFASAEDRDLALTGLEMGFDDFPETDKSWGPGLWRARNGRLTFRSAKPEDCHKKAERSILVAASESTSRVRPREYSRQAASEQGDGPLDASELLMREQGDGRLEELDDKDDPARKFQSGFTSNLAGARKLQERQMEAAEKLEMKEIELFLRKQRQLDRRARAAEAVAAQIAALAAKPDTALDSDSEDEKEDDRMLYADWKEDVDAQAILGKPAQTTWGPGRITRAICTKRAGRLLTVRLLAGGSLQAPEAKVLAWTTVVERCLGDCLYPPQLASAAETLEGKPLSPWQLQQRQKQAGASKVGFVAAEAVNLQAGKSRDHPELALRLVPSDGSKVHFVNLHDLERWSHAEARIYLVELCATPATVGHLAPFRHDYRAARDPYAKGDLVLVEGSRPGTMDVGTVRKVILGEKGEKLLAATAGANATSAKRVVRRCTVDDRKKRDGPMKALEEAALPLLQARLPSGAQALGVGASSDGSFLRLFVQLGAGMARKTAASAAAAAAAGLGALLGCETELLASEGVHGSGTAPGPPASGDREKATSMKQTGGSQVDAVRNAEKKAALVRQPKDDKKKKKDKHGKDKQHKKGVKEKAKKKKRPSSSSSNSA